jgi:hypothetical protein
MWLSWKSLGQLAVLYTLVAWAKNKTVATGEAAKMILEDRKEHRGYGVILTSIIAKRENMHGKLKGSHKMKKARLAQQRKGIASASRARREWETVERWDAW